MEHISGQLCANVRCNEAVNLFSDMMYSDISPNCFTYSIIIKLCANELNPELGRSIQAQTVKVGFEDDVIVGGVLVDAYAKLGFLDDACQMFWNLEEKDNVVWSALLAGFHHVGDAERGLKFYFMFLSEGNKPDPFTFASFSLCSNSEAGAFGIQMHCSLLKYGFIINSVLGSSLTNMHDKLGMVGGAYKCFHEAEYKNEICYNAIINSLILNSNNETAIALFSEMRKVGITPCQSTIRYIFGALVIIC